MSTIFVEIRFTNEKIVVSGFKPSGMFYREVLPAENLYSVFQDLFDDVGGAVSFEAHYLYPLYLVGDAARNSGPIRARFNAIYEVP